MNVLILVLIHFYKPSESVETERPEALKIILKWITDLAATEKFRLLLKVIL